MSEGRPTFGICSIPARVRAYTSNDLDSHVSFIRKSLAAGVTYKKIAADLGVTKIRIWKYAKKMNMVSGRLPSLRHQDYPGTGPIGVPSYSPKSGEL